MLEELFSIDEVRACLVTRSSTVLPVPPTLSDVDRVEPMGPPASTSMPACWAGSVASMTACAMSAVSSPVLMSSSTDENAVWPVVADQTGRGICRRIGCGIHV